MPPRYDWYQTDSKVVITVLLKNAVEKNYNCEIFDNAVKLTAENYDLQIELFHPIIESKSSHKATPLKVEISLAKAVGERWEKLEKIEDSKPALEDLKPLVLGKTDWDKFAAEVAKTDDAEAVAEENLSKLFQKIYSTSSEETRRAMNKSFTESGGTVLSTNWKEVGEKKVDVKPPDGAEYKTWDG